MFSRFITVINTIVKLLRKGATVNSVNNSNFIKLNRKITIYIYYFRAFIIVPRVLNKDKFKTPLNLKVITPGKTIYVEYLI